MTPRDRHLEKMKEIEKQIEKAKGITHRNDLNGCNVTKYTRYFTMKK